MFISEFNNNNTHIYNDNELNIDSLRNTLKLLQLRHIRNEDKYIYSNGEASAHLIRLVQKENVLKHENKYLYEELNTIRNINEFTSQIQKVFDIKYKKLHQNELLLKKQIRQYECQIIHMKNKEKALKRSNELIQRVLKNKNETAYIQLQNELNKLNDIINTNNESISHLKDKIKEHKDCDVTYQQLLMKLNLLKKEHEFLLKKYENKDNNTSNRNEHNERYSNYNDNEFINKNKSNKTYVKLVLSKSCEDCICKDNNIRKGSNTLSKSCDDVLFKNNEKKILEEIMPKDILDKYEGKFDDVVKLMKMIESKRKEMEENKRILIDNKYDIVMEIENNLKVANNESILLNKDVSDLKKKIMDVKMKIKQSKSILVSNNKEIERLNKENEDLKMTINTIMNGGKVSESNISNSNNTSESDNNRYKRIITYKQGIQCLKENSRSSLILTRNYSVNKICGSNLNSTNSNSTSNYNGSLLSKINNYNQSSSCDRNNNSRLGAIKHKMLFKVYSHNQNNVPTTFRSVNSRMNSQCSNYSANVNNSNNNNTPIIKQFKSTGV